MVEVASYRPFLHFLRFWTVKTSFYRPISHFLQKWTTAVQSLQTLRGGRERAFSPLASANTPHREPEGLAVVADIQATATTTVAQEVLAGAIVRGS